MAVGIAIRDDIGITQWAPYSEKGGNAGRQIIRQLQMAAKPKLALACEGWNNPTPRVRQIKRVSTRISSVTCMACILRM